MIANGKVYSQCDFVYTKKGLKGNRCDEFGWVDELGTVRCKNHRLNRLSSAHKNGANYVMQMFAMQQRMKLMQAKLDESNAKMVKLEDELIAIKMSDKKYSEKELKEAIEQEIVRRKNEAEMKGKEDEERDKLIDDMIDSGIVDIK
jgi:hypothetical protein